MEEFYHGKTTYSDSKHFVVPMHWHKNVEIMQIYKGSAELAIGTGTYSASAGYILIINQEELHRIESDDPTLHYGTFIFPLQSLSFETRDAMDWKQDCILDSIMIAAKKKYNGYELYINQNFTSFLNEIRIEEACILLSETDRTVLDIAYVCGYENVSYFNRGCSEQT